MKVLMHFIDMISPARIASSTDDSLNPLLGLLNQWGGTYFTQIYSTAPDTPRSLAQVFSGLDSRENGCVLRTQWPGYFLDDKLGTIFSDFSIASLEVAAVLAPIEWCGRFIPTSNREFVHRYDSVQELARDCFEGQLADDFAVFVQDNDYHHEVDRRLGHQSAHAAGSARIATNLSTVLDAFGEDFFDFAIVFSDHGCMLSQDSLQPLDWLDNLRTNVLLHVRQRSEDRFQENATLHQLSDIRPFVREILGLPQVVPNKHAIGSDVSRSHVVIEDHGTKESFPSGLPDIWRVVTPLASYTEEINGKWKAETESGSENCGLEAIEVRRRLRPLLQEAPLFSLLNRSDADSVAGRQDFTKVKAASFWDGKAVSGRRFSLLRFRFLVYASRLRRRVRDLELQVRLKPTRMDDD